MPAQRPLFALALLAAFAPVAAHAAQAWSGFPKKLGELASTPVTHAVIDGQPSLVLAAGGQLHCHRLDARPCPGFPLALGEKTLAVGAPAVGDLDGDGRPEIALGVTGGRLLVFTSDGTPLPFAPAADSEAGPSILDVDGDGRRELVFGTRQGLLHAYA
ncbi:MAG: FG-GAP repeat domain-containing protein, partial [Myxococcales bacterium]